MNDPNRSGLPLSPLAELRRILQPALAVQRAILFGSRAKDTFKRGPDIEQALEANDLSAEVIGRFARAFEESSIPYQVDLCWLEAVNHPALRDPIALLGQVRYERASMLTSGGSGGGAMWGLTGFRQPRGCHEEVAVTLC